MGESRAIWLLWECGSYLPGPVRAFDSLEAAIRETGPLAGTGWIEVGGKWYRIGEPGADGNKLYVLEKIEVEGGEADGGIGGDGPAVGGVVRPDGGDGGPGEDLGPA